MSMKIHLIALFLLISSSVDAATLSTITGTSSTNAQAYSDVLDAFQAAPNCPNDGSHALVYNSSTKTVSCASITGGGGGSGDPAKTYLSCGGTDDTSAINSAWSTAVSTGAILQFPCNQVCKATSQLSLDFGSRVEGMMVQGCGPGSSRFESTATTSPAIKFYCSGSTAPASTNCLNLKINDLRFVTNLNGVGVQFAKDDYSDNINDLKINNVVFGNSSSGSSGVVVKFNYVLHSTGDFETAKGGNGDCVQATNLQFSTFHMTGGGCTNSLHFMNGPSGSGGYNYGNTFPSPDFEVSSVNWKLEGAAPNFNTFIGGQWNFSTNGVNASSGSGNLLIKPNQAPASGGLTFVSGSGVTVQ